MTYSYRTQPYAHQRDYARVSAGRVAFALLSEYGTGKTKMLVDEMAMLWEAGEVTAVLVTTAKGTYANWPEEIERHMPRSVPRCVYMWTGSGSARDRRDQREILEAQDCLRIVVVNIEALAVSTRARNLALRFLGTSQRRMSIVDESTLIKNPEAQRTRVMVKIAGVSEYRRIATGNPTPHSPLDLWGQFLFLGQGNCSRLLGHHSWWSFRARYAVLQDKYTTTGRTIQVPVAYRNLDELHHRLAPHSFRVRKEDCLDLPPKIYQMRHIEMTPEQARLYEDVRRRAWAELDGQATISATQVMAQMSKLHQILCGQVRDDDGVVHEVPTRRTEAMLDAVEESGRATIVWCAYRANVVAVAAALRRDYGEDSVVEFHGGVEQAARQRAVARFERGDAHFMVATPHSGGRGNTWNAGKTVVFYSNPWDLELRLNAEDRNHRIGQTVSVNYVDIVVPGTLDERIVRSLREKIDISAVVNGDTWRQWVI